MVIGLLTASLLSLVCFGYTAWLGFGVHGPSGIGNHFLYGFFTTFLVTLAQSMTMFFFIGTGKQVKDLVAKDEKGPEFIKRTKQFKAKTFPAMLWAMIFTMATMIVGGGVHTRVMPSLHLGWIHGGLATVALYYNLVATWRNAKYMIEHNMLMEEVEKRLVASPGFEMIPGAIAGLCYSTRIPFPPGESVEDVTTFIESRTLPYATQSEEEFVQRALKLGVESGMVLDVGTGVGLIALKLLWQNENLYSIGIDRSGLMIEHARATAEAWDVGGRAVFQVGDPLKMRFKTAYFDLAISDSSLHRFENAAAVLREIRRVLKPKGALLIRDFRRPNRFRMAAHMKKLVSRFGESMRQQIETSIRSSYTETELKQIAVKAEFPGLEWISTNSDYITIERRGETDPGSWIIAREQYR